MSGCGGSSRKPQYCSDRSTLQQSVKDLGDVKVLTSGGEQDLQTQLQKVETDARTLAGSAKSDFPTETSAIQSSLSKLKGDVQGLSSPPTRQQLAALVTDVAVIPKDEEGKVHVAKHEKPAQHGAWGGIAVGALAGIIFPPSVLGAAAVGGVVGGVGGHLRKGMSRGDMQELGELLESGQAALIVIGESRVEEQLDKALTRAVKSIEKEIDADREEFKRELEAAEKEDAAG